MVPLARGSFPSIPIHGLRSTNFAMWSTAAHLFFLDILPQLPKGVLVGIHDIFLPFDYPPEWTGRMYNEMYMLAAYLLGRRDNAIEFAAFWMSRRMAPAVDALFAFDSDRRIQRHGGCFFWVS